MLRESARVLKPGGMLACWVIAGADCLANDPGLQQRAREAGPDFLDAGPGYPRLLAEAGFDTITMTDLTAEYAETTAGWLRERKAEANDLIDLMGQGAFEEKISSGRKAIEAIADGLLKRYLVIANRPRR